MTIHHRKHKRHKRNLFLCFYVFRDEPWLLLRQGQAFARDTVVDYLPASLNQGCFDIGLASGLAIDAHATATTRAADFRGLCPVPFGDFDQLVNERRSDCWDKLAAAGPFFGEDRADLIKFVTGERLVNLQRRVANAVEAAEDAGIAVNMLLVHLPVVDAGVARRASEAERHTGFQFI